jgi:hypothetical protein
MWRTRPAHASDDNAEWQPEDHANPEKRQGLPGDDPAQLATGEPERLQDG